MVSLWVGPPHGPFLEVKAKHDKRVVSPCEAAHGLMMPAILSAIAVPTMTGYTVSRDESDVPSAATDLAEEFFGEVKNGRDEQTEVPGGYGSYPRAYVVELPDGSVYIGFATGLPEEREPWMVGFKPVTRDTVIDATSDTLEAVEGDEADLVNDLIAAADDA